MLVIRTRQGRRLAANLPGADGVYGVVRMLGRSAHKRGAAAAMCTVLLVCVAGFITAPARASVVRLHGTIVGSPAWAATSALVAVSAQKSTAVELIDPQSGKAQRVAALTPEYGKPRAMALGTGFAFEGTHWGCGSRECSKYEGGGLDARDLLFQPPGGALRCVAQLYGNGCATPNTCVVGSAVVSGPLLAYPGCSNGGYEETGSVLFDSATSQLQIVPQIALPLSLSGRWLVGLAPGWNPAFNQPPGGKTLPVLVERDVLSGAEALRISLPPWTHGVSGPNEELPAVAAVQEDGTIAYAVAAGGRTALWTASPSQPVPRQVMTIHASMGWLALLQPPLVLREGRIAFPDAEGQEYGPREVAVATLAGVRLGSLRVLAQDGFDYDSTHVLAASTPCSKSFLLTWAPGEAQPRVPGDGCTSARLAHVRFAAGRIVLELRCPEEVDVGCETGEISISGGPISLTAEGEQLLPGEREHLALRLPDSGRRWLRRHPRANLTVRWGQHSHRRVRVPRS
jgi:hypothetical protein